MPDADVAGLLGVSARTVGNWRRGGVVRANDRVVLVAQLLSYLEGSMTQRGLLLWFASPQDGAGGRSPCELLSGDLGEARRGLVPLVPGAALEALAGVDVVFPVLHGRFATHCTLRTPMRH